MYKIPESWGKREPRTPVELRKDLITHGQPFDKKFDWDTLFADAIRVDDVVLLIGPPLYELKNNVKFTVDGKAVPHSFIDLDRVQYTIVSTKSNTLNIDDLEITVRDRSTSFSGCGYVMCMQKNEPFHWIEDWIRFNYLEHGVRGFAIYNNQSTDYTNEELIEAMSKIDLDVVVECIDWDMPHGPNTPYWDCDFARYIMFEHSKHMFGWCASYALNQDIDEFFLVDGGNISDVIDFMKDSGYNSIIYGNRNIDPYNERLNCSASSLSPRDRVYKDYYYYSDKFNTDNLVGGDWAISKWITIPKLTMNFQWKNHDIPGSNNLVTDKSEYQIYFAHFYSMQSKNKDNHYVHSDRNVSKIDTEDLKLDQLLQTKLQLHLP